MRPRPRAPAPAPAPAGARAPASRVLSPPRAAPRRADSLPRAAGMRGEDREAPGSYISEVKTSSEGRGAAGRGIPRTRTRTPPPDPRSCRLPPSIPAGGRGLLGNPGRQLHPSWAATEQLGQGAPGPGGWSRDPCAKPAPAAKKSAWVSAAQGGAGSRQARVCPGEATGMFLLLLGAVVMNAGLLS